MKIRFTGDISRFKQGIAEIAPLLRFTPVEEGGIAVAVSCRPEGTRAARNGDTGEISYNALRPVSFFRALSLFCEYSLQSDSFDTNEQQHLDSVSLMADASRNAVATTATVKRLLRHMALMGIDTLMMYTEDTYEVKESPYFGYMRGRYTHDEQREMDDYAYALGIEMMPCIQTLGHLINTLRWNRFHSIRDTADILLAGEEETYAFLEKAVGAASAPYRSKRIHIGMDEAYELGSGAYLARHGLVPRTQIMRSHLSRIVQICEKLDLTPMMWGDMYINMGSQSGWCFDPDSEITDEIVDACDRRVELVYWDYNHANKEDYLIFIKKFKRFHNKLIYAGAVHSWNSFSVQYDRTFHNSNNALSACKDEGVRDVMCTIWGDNGAENHLFACLLGIQLYAEHMYAHTVDDEKLRRRFKTCTGMNMDAYMDLKYLDLTPYTDPLNLSNSNPSKWLLYQDILTGLFDKHVEHMDMDVHYAKCAALFRNHLDSGEPFADVFLLPYLVSRVLSVKANLGVRLHKLYHDGDRDGLRGALSDLDTLRGYVRDLQVQHRALWHDYYKPFGFDVFDIRYGSILARIDTAQVRLDSYLSGRLDTLDELEQQQLYFNCYCDENWPLFDTNDWIYMVSPNPL